MKSDKVNWDEFSPFVENKMFMTYDRQLVTIITKASQWNFDQYLEDEFELTAWDQESKKVYDPVGVEMTKKKGQKHLDKFGKPIIIHMVPRITVIQIATKRNVFLFIIGINQDKEILKIVR